MCRRRMIHKKSFDGRSAQAKATLKIKSVAGNVVLFSAPIAVIIKEMRQPGLFAGDL